MPPRTPRPPTEPPVLLVVESPAKARTVKQLLGPGFDVRATSGHVKDLPAAREGVDVEHGFAPSYEVLKGKNRVLSELKRAARGASRVLLATDPDREGEAIAFHVAEEITAPGDERVARVMFHELTKGGLTRALAAPQRMGRDRYDAQQARRVLDRLVGFTLSAALWEKVRRGLSAGRVQSVAVRVVVERERAIRDFAPVTTFTVEADVVTGEAAAGAATLRARLLGPDGRVARFRSSAEAEAARAALEGRELTVGSVQRTPRERPPPPPFTTATLQQEASRRLGFAPRRTMALAQHLFEGVELGEAGLLGLITYLRTDSVRLSTEAVDAAREVIARVHGPEYLPAGPVSHRGRPRAQAGHEAIRPTSTEWPPEAVAPLLTGAGSRDLGRLYALIWDRFLACQMAPAVIEQGRAVLESEGGRLGVEGEGLAFAGWLAALEDSPKAQAAVPRQAGEEADRDLDPSPPPPGGGEGRDEGAAGAVAHAPLPPLTPGQRLCAAALAVERHVTTPPPRFDEASLVHELEARGIGRPSTYASILETIQEKRYVERVEKCLRPTDLGVRVTDWLVGAFPRVLDAAFTAGLEDELDRIEAGELSWQEVLRRFWVPFAAEVAAAKGAPGGGPAGSGIRCDKCGRHELVIRWGKNGEFLACPGYPECRHTLNFRREEGAIVPVRDEAEAVAEPCPKCSAPMVARRGRFGRFLACSRFPACDGKRAPSIGVTCPRCGGEVVEKRSARGKTFYGCSTWSREGGCEFVSWDRPRNEPCPRCGGSWLTERFSRREGPVVACPNPACGFQRAATAGPAA